MDEIYLDSNSKEYYYSDFKENVLTETNEFWKLNETIKPYLIELNNCRKIQPIFSKFPDNDNSLSNFESHINFAYTKDLELNLFREIIPYFVYQYNQPFESRFHYSFFKPKDNIIFRKESKFKLGCILNQNYFRINHLNFVYENHNNDKHIEFWKDITSIFKEIK